MSVISVLFRNANELLSSILDNLIEEDQHDEIAGICSRVIHILQNPMNTSNLDVVFDQLKDTLVYLSFVDPSPWRKQSYQLVLTDIESAEADYMSGLSWRTYDTIGRLLHMTRSSLLEQPDSIRACQEIFMNSDCKERAFEEIFDSVPGHIAALHSNIQSGLLSSFLNERATAVVRELELME